MFVFFALCCFHMVLTDIGWPVLRLNRAECKVFNSLSCYLRNYVVPCVSSCVRPKTMKVMILMYACPVLQELWKTGFIEHFCVLHEPRFHLQVLCPPKGTEGIHCGPGRPIYKFVPILGFKFYFMSFWRTLAGLR